MRTLLSFLSHNVPQNPLFKATKNISSIKKYHNTFVYSKNIHYLCTRKCED